ncbi:MAG: ATP-binding protein [Thermodesulfobacteriota bacterium]
MSKEKDISVVYDQRRLVVRFPSLVDHINRVEDETRQFLEKNGLSGEFFPVCLVMRESLLNAVKHGNRLDPRKTVTYTLTLADDMLTIEVEDQGEGFDWRSIPLSPPSQEAENGRGIFIMRRYFPKLTYNGKGNKLTMARSRRAEDVMVRKKTGAGKR